VKGEKSVFTIASTNTDWTADSTGRGGVPFQKPKVRTKRKLMSATDATKSGSAVGDAGETTETDDATQKALDEISQKLKDVQRRLADASISKTGKKNLFESGIGHAKEQLKVLEGAPEAYMSKGSATATHGATFLGYFLDSFEEAVGRSTDLPNGEQLRDTLTEKAYTLYIEARKKLDDEDLSRTTSEDTPVPFPHDDSKAELGSYNLASLAYKHAVQAIDLAEENQRKKVYTDSQISDVKRAEKAGDAEMVALKENKRHQMSLLRTALTSDDVAKLEIDVQNIAKKIRELKADQWGRRAQLTLLDLDLLNLETPTTQQIRWKREFGKALAEDREIVNDGMIFAALYNEAFVKLYDAGMALIDKSGRAKQSPLNKLKKSKDGAYNLVWKAYVLASDALRRESGLENKGIPHDTWDKVAEIRKALGKRTTDYSSVIWSLIFTVMRDFLEVVDQFSQRSSDEGTFKEFAQAYKALVKNIRESRRYKDRTLTDLQKLFSFPEEKNGQDATYRDALKAYTAAKKKVKSAFGIEDPTTSLYDHQFKVLIIGDSGVGKTRLLLRFAENTFTEGYMATIGVDFKIRTIDVGGKNIKFQLWDTAGQERFRTITSSYYRGAHGIIIAYESTDRTSFDNVIKWKYEIDRYASKATPPVVFLASTKNDLVLKRDAGIDGATKVNEIKASKFFETSAKNNENVDEMFTALAKAMLKAKMEREQTGKREVDTPSARKSTTVRRVETAGGASPTPPPPPYTFTPSASRREPDEPKKTFVFDFDTLQKGRRFAVPKWSEPKPEPVLQKFVLARFWEYGPWGTNGFSEDDDKLHWKYVMGLEPKPKVPEQKKRY